MKAFWWFKEKTIAGMARPGFNRIQWFDLSLPEALVFSWIGKRSCSTQNINSFYQHVAHYGSQIRPFYQLSLPEFTQLQAQFHESTFLEEIFRQVAQKTHCIEDFWIHSQSISFQLNGRRLNWEMDFLRQNEIETVVSLTETHDQVEKMGLHFELHHLAINDLGTPHRSQVEKLAEIIDQCCIQKRKLVVHCMAGVGRTSMMLLGAHCLLGENLEEMLLLLSQQNPTYQFVGPQAEFVKSLRPSSSVACQSKGTKSK